MPTAGVIYYKFNYNSKDSIGHFDDIQTAVKALKTIGKNVNSFL